jgi:mono/diheme cytochrome c family protein
MLTSTRRGIREVAQRGQRLSLSSVGRFEVSRECRIARTTTEPAGPNPPLMRNTAYVILQPMTSSFWITGTALAVLAAGQSTSAAREPVAKPSRMSATAQRNLVDQYCVGCHNQKLKTGGLAPDTVDLSRPAEHAETLEKVIRKLRAGMMPPAGSKRPEAAA